MNSQKTINTKRGGPVIRLGTKRDASTIASISNSHYKTRGAQETTISELADQGLVVVAESEQEIVGFAVAQSLTSEIAELTDLLVLGKFQAKGIGSQLVRELEDVLAINHTTLFVVNYNSAKPGEEAIKTARSFYLNNGYQLVSEGERSRVLTKNLTRDLTESYVISKNSSKPVSLNANDEFEIASIIKAPLLTEVLKKILADPTLPNHKIKVLPRHSSKGSGVIEWSKKRSYRVKYLIKLVIIHSDCVATNMLIDFIGGPTAFKDIVERRYKKSRYLCEYVQLEEGVDSGVATSTATDCYKMITDYYEIAEKLPKVQKKIARWSRSSWSWFNVLMPSAYTPLVIKSGSMYGTGVDETGFCMNIVAVLKHDNGSIVTVAYLSNGSAKQLSKPIIALLQKSATNKLSSIMSRL